MRLSHRMTASDSNQSPLYARHLTNFQIQQSHRSVRGASMFADSLSPRDLRDKELPPEPPTSGDMSPSGELPSQQRLVNLNVHASCIWHMPHATASTNNVLCIRIKVPVGRVYPCERCGDPTAGDDWQGQPASTRHT